MKILEKSKLKALIIVSSTAQVEMFSLVAQQLVNWNILVVNTDRSNKKLEIEKVLQGLNLPYQTIAGLTMGKVKYILNTYKPDIVILGHDRNLLDRLFIKQSNSMDIPTLLIQDGIIAASRELKLEIDNFSFELWSTIPNRIFKFLVNHNFSWQNKLEFILSELIHGGRGKKGVYGHGECSKMAVFGESVKNKFILEGIDPERILITGNPKFDNVYNSKNTIIKKLVYQKWGISQNEKVILVLTQYLVEAGVWRPEQRKEFVLSIAKAAEELPNTRLIIKLHPPHENEEDYKVIIKDLKPQPIICKYASLTELYNICSFAITVSSTAGLEAMVLEKPIMIVNLYKNNGSNFYLNSGAIFAEKIEDILPAMKKALYDFQTQKETQDTMRKFVFDQAYIQDGKTSERIANLIIKMVNDNQVKQLKTKNEM